MSHEDPATPSPSRSARRPRTSWLARGGLVLAVGLCLVSSAVPAAGADVARVMPLGDSITDGYGVPGGYRIDLEDGLLADGRRVDFVGSLSNGTQELADREHEGHNGWRIDQVAAGVEGWLDTHDPDVVLLKIGTNDMVRGHDVARAPQRLGALVDRIAARAPSATVLVSTLAPLGWPDGEARVRAFNAELPALVQDRARQGQRVHLVDMHSALTRQDLSDGIHPSRAGYSKMAAVWRNALQDVLAAQAAPAPPPSDPPPADPPPADPPAAPPPLPPPPPVAAGAPAGPAVAPVDPVARRLAGPDRYATAAAIVREAFPSGPVPVAFVTTGETYADALAGGPAAHVARGPVLPVPRAGVPEPVRAELLRLRPARIVVLGGPQAVSDRQAAELGAYTTGSVTRVAGGDRYDTAAQVATSVFTGPVPHVLIATGEGFADALSAGAAGAGTRSPVLLVSPTALPSTTADALRRLRPGRITVVGGPSAVSDRVLELLAGSTTGGGAIRVAGADRYATAALLARAVWPDAASVVHLATGRDFPDALAGIAVSARAGGPLLLTEPGCLPAPTESELDRLQPTTVVVLGGTGTVSEAAARGLPCPTSG